MGIRRGLLIDTSSCDGWMDGMERVVMRRIPLILLNGICERKVAAAK